MLDRTSLNMISPHLSCMSDEARTTAHALISRVAAQGLRPTVPRQPDKNHQFSMNLGEGPHLEHARLSSRSLCRPRLLASVPPCSHRLSFERCDLSRVAQKAIMKS